MFGFTRLRRSWQWPILMIRLIRQGVDETFCVEPHAA